MNCASDESGEQSNVATLPVANKAIVRRICQQLLACPPFYTRVVCLMQTMKLPSPFDDANEPDASSGNETDAGRNPSVISRGATKRRQRTLKTGLIGEYKRAKAHEHPVAQCSASLSENAADSTFENATFDRTRPHISIIPVQLRRPVAMTNVSTLESHSDNSTTQSPFGVLSKSLSGVATDEIAAAAASQPVLPVQVYTDEEIAANVMSPDEIAHHPAFRNYDIGHACATLYVKNIARKVTEHDLRRVYLRYVDTSCDCEMNTCVNVITSGYCVQVIILLCF